MGKALYRTYRSRSFDDVVGQEHITTTLKNAIEKQKISHAYLFTGPRGVGKTSIARILAHAVNNLPYDDESTHLDIIEIDAASNRRIDEMRELRDKVHIAPTSAKYKVYIIDEVHMLTREAFNALLKTLEEPPEHVLFILATTEFHKVPDTIVSRTQRFNFKAIGSDDAVNHLKMIAEKEHIAVSDDALELIAAHGQGSFRDSISLLDQIAAMGLASADKQAVAELLGIPDEVLVAKIVDALSSKDASALIAALHSMKQKSVSPQVAAKAVSGRLRNQLVEQSDQNTARLFLNVLKNILRLTNSSQGDFLALEIGLLDPLFEQGSVALKTATMQATRGATQEAETVAEKPDKRAVENDEKKTPAKLEEAEGAPESNITEETPTAVAPSEKDGWKALLGELKGTHTTLYGVLRMAKPEIMDSELLLTFNFGFHKTQVDSPKNALVLLEHAKKHLGVKSVKTVSKKSDPKTPHDSAKKHAVQADKIAPEIDKSISNIFGDVELLES